MEYEKKIIEGLGVVQDMLQEYYKLVDLRVVYDKEALEAWIEPEGSWNMTQLFADERFDVRLEAALDKMDLQMVWQTPDKFWLSPIS